jgi:hypothetical protein
VVLTNGNRQKGTLLFILENMEHHLNNMQIGDVIDNTFFADKTTRDVATIDVPPLDSVFIFSQQVVSQCSHRIDAGRTGC